MTQKEFRKLELGDKVLLHGGLQGKILFFAKLHRRKWFSAEKHLTPNGIYFQPERPGQEVDADDAFYIHRVGIRSKI